MTPGKSWIDMDRITPARAATGAGTMLIACAIASTALLAAHAGSGGSPDFAGMLRTEAAQAFPCAIVHGGFVLVLALEVAGFAALAVRAGYRRTWVLAALVFTGMGAGFLAASMIVDGLITPAIAARYATVAADQQASAKALFVLIGAAIRVLMPAGLAFQGMAALAWGAALVPFPGAARAGSAAGLALGAIAIGAIALSLTPIGMVGLMLALMSMTAWTLVAGVVLASWPDLPSQAAC